MGETLNNLCKAFIGESQARNRYTYYSKIAEKEGFIQISKLFLEIAEQEKQHAKKLFEHIQELKENNESIEIPTEVPTVYKTTAENLQAAIDGENYETLTMYPEFAEKAEKEGHQAIANRLKSIAKAEEHHKEIYTKLLTHIKNETILKREEQIIWVCQECGYFHLGKMPPKKCPSCDHTKEYFKVKCENF